MSSIAVSIVVPTLDEADVVLAALQHLRRIATPDIEIIVVDGGSRDATLERARELAHRVEVAPRGRAIQMNAGAALARGDLLVFLHADTRLSEAALAALRRIDARATEVWGRFDVVIDSRHRLLRLVAALMNLRSRLTGIATGDQAIFVTRRTFERIGGFPQLPLMEDVALCARLRRISRPLCARERVVTSARRWEHDGALRTILLMWSLRLAFRLGADPAALARVYGHGPRSR
jgi:rSAM/selenodomain-associated transferase 2